MVDNALVKVRQLDRSKILHRVVRENSTCDRVKAVFRYDKRLPCLSAIFTKHWRVMVADDKRLVQVFPKPPMISFTRGKNLREELCQVKLPPLRMSRQEDGSRRCGKASCRLCPYTGGSCNGGSEKLTYINISSTGEDLPIQGQIGSVIDKTFRPPCHLSFI